MLNYDHALGGQLHHLPAFYLQDWDLTQILLTCWTDLYPMADHAIRRFDHLQMLSRMTYLTSGLLLALFAQALGLPLKAIGGGRQMAIVTVFRQARVQVFDLCRKQGNLLALPLDQLLLHTHLLLQAALLFVAFGMIFCNYSGGLQRFVRIGP
jgi:hypothetical protein